MLDTCGYINESHKKAETRPKKKKNWPYNYPYFYYLYENSRVDYSKFASWRSSRYAHLIYNKC